MDIDYAYLWMIGGGILLGVETLLLPGVGVIFAGLGAVTVGVALLLGLPESAVAQFTLFFAATALWGALLWKPMRRAMSGSSPGYGDMVGQPAKVVKGGLSKDANGVIAWSGSFLTARLDPASARTRLDEGADVVISRMEKGVALVTGADETPDTSSTV
ncbi:MAG: hypothetical protein HQK87_11975 [Nitrospinae bacterium]|nr:hypothetical protein [Nitrospinota bacterium]